MTPGDIRPDGVYVLLAEGGILDPLVVRVTGELVKASPTAAIPYHAVVAEIVQRGSTGKKTRRHVDAYGLSDPARWLDRLRAREEALELELDRVRAAKLRADRFVQTGQIGPYRDPWPGQGRP